MYREYSAVVRKVERRHREFNNLVRRGIKARGLHVEKDPAAYRRAIWLRDNGPRLKPAQDPIMAARLTLRHPFKTPPDRSAAIASQVTTILAGKAALRLRQVRKFFPDPLLMIGVLDNLGRNFGHHESFD
jgi:hypothetical protein